MVRLVVVVDVVRLVVVVVVRLVVVVVAVGRFVVITGGSRAGTGNCSYVIISV